MTTPRLVVLCVEDEPDVRDAIVRDLAPFEPTVVTETAESADDAREAIDEIKASGDRLGLVLADHLLPGTYGVDFLVELHDDPVNSRTKKVLLTGEAGLDVTIKAINRADLDRYIAKPWQPDDLRGIVKHLLTDFVVEHVDDVLPYLTALDSGRLLEVHGTRAADR